MKLKIILPACEIPLGSTVTRPFGSKVYQIDDRIRIFGVEGQPSTVQTISAPAHVRFIKGTGFSEINAIGFHEELCWHVEESDLLTFLEERSES